MLVIGHGTLHKMELNCQFWKVRISFRHLIERNVTQTSREERPRRRVTTIIINLQMVKYHFQCALSDGLKLFAILFHSFRTDFMLNWPGWQNAKRGDRVLSGVRSELFLSLKTRIRLALLSHPYWPHGNSPQDRPLCFPCSFLGWDKFRFKYCPSLHLSRSRAPPLLHLS